MGQPVFEDEKSTVSDATLLYGFHPVREALLAGRPIDRLYLLRGRFDSRMEDLIQSARKSGASVQFQPRVFLDRLAKTEKHQGLVAVLAAQAAVSVRDLLNGLKRASDPAWPPLLVLLDEVEDPRNLGAVVRTAEAAGAHGLIIPERRAAGLTPTVAKASAGATALLPVARVVNLGRAMEEVKEAGLWVFGLDTEGKEVYWEADFRQPVALIAGAEGKGLRQKVKEACDHLVRIPMRGRVGSLNVSAAMAVVLYEVVRQRARKDR
jgi:23S rRNA (guanosine2251-2'-O)-methyltransferase